MSNKRFNARLQFPTGLTTNKVEILVTDPSDAQQMKLVTLESITNPLKGIQVTQDEAVVTSGEATADAKTLTLTRPEANYLPYLRIVSVNGKYAIGATTANGTATASTVPVDVSGFADEAGEGDFLQLTTYWKFDPQFTTGGGTGPN